MFNNAEEQKAFFNIEIQLEDINNLGRTSKKAEGNRSFQETEDMVIPEFNSLEERIKHFDISIQLEDISQLGRGNHKAENTTTTFDLNSVLDLNNSRIEDNNTNHPPDINMLSNMSDIDLVLWLEERKRYFDISLQLEDIGSLGRKQNQYKTDSDDTAVFQIDNHGQNQLHFESANIYIPDDTHDIENQSSNEMLNRDLESLAAFRFKSGSVHEYVNQQNIEDNWVVPGENIVIRGRKITLGLFYEGIEDSRYFNQGYINKKINTLLPREYSYLEDDDSLSFYSHYDELSPKARGAYLDWLASDRTHPETLIEYVFFYFCGLANRIINLIKSEKNKDAEILTIIDELLRIKKIYCEDETTAYNSLGYNINQLVLFIAQAKFNLFKARATDMGAEFELFLNKLAVAQKIKNSEPIDGEHAFSWLASVENYVLRTPAKRCWALFKKLFILKFDQKHQTGLLVKENKKRLTISYYGLPNSVTFIHDDLPEISALTIPIRRLIELADATTDALDATSRYLGRNHTTEMNYKAISLLPDELITIDNFPLLKQFNQWADNLIMQTDGVTSASEFYRQFGLETTSPTKNDIDTVIHLAAMLDIGIAPQLDIHHIKLQNQHQIVLYRPVILPEQKLTRHYNDMLTAIQMCWLTFNKGSRPSLSQLELITHFIQQQSVLKQAEKAALTAYLHFLIQNDFVLKRPLDPSLNFTKDIFDDIKTLLIELITGHNNKTIDYKQVEWLKDKFDLSLNSENNNEDLRDDNIEITVPKAPPKSDDVSQSRQEATNTNEFTIDLELVSEYKKNTTEVQSLLESIFSTDPSPPQKTSSTTSTTTETETETETEASQIKGEMLTGLEHPYSILFNYFSQKAVWNETEINVLCSLYKVMPSAAIEVINTWACDKLNDYVLIIEEVNTGDAIEFKIDLDIIQEIKELEL